MAYNLNIYLKDYGIETFSDSITLTTDDPYLICEPTITRTLILKKDGFINCLDCSYFYRLLYAPIDVFYDLLYIKVDNSLVINTIPIYNDDIKCYNDTKSFLKQWHNEVIFTNIGRYITFSLTETVSYDASFSNYGLFTYFTKCGNLNNIPFVNIK